jgi:hypothetical protein
MFKKIGRGLKSIGRATYKAAAITAKIVYNPDNNKLFSTDHVMTDMHNAAFENTPLEILSEEKKQIRDLEKENKKIKNEMENTFINIQNQEVANEKNKAEFTLAKEASQQARETATKFETNFKDNMTDAQKSDVSRAEKELTYALKRKKAMSGSLKGRASTILTSPLGINTAKEQITKKRKTLLGE